MTDGRVEPLRCGRLSGDGHPRKKQQQVLGRMPLQDNIKKRVQATRKDWRCRDRHSFKWLTTRDTHHLLVQGRCHKFVRETAQGKMLPKFLPSRLCCLSLDAEKTTLCASTVAKALFLAPHMRGNVVFLEITSKSAGFCKLVTVDFSSGFNPNPSVSRVTNSLECTYKRNWCPISRSDFLSTPRSDCRRQPSPN